MGHRRREWCSQDPRSPSQHPAKPNEKVGLGSEFDADIFSCAVFLDCNFSPRAIVITALNTFRPTPCSI